MVKVTYCDRCGKELERIDRIAENSFDEMFDKFDNISGGLNLKITNSKLIRQLILPQLCPHCLKSYNKIIDRANKEIKIFLKEKGQC